MSGFRYNPTTGENLSAAALEAAYKRDSTLEFQQVQTTKIADSYEDPANFFRLKARAIGEVARKASEVYREQYLKLVGDAYKVPAALAHNRAMKLANNFEQLLRADVEADFPSNLSDLSLQLTYDRGGAAQSGFATPSTKVQGIESAPRKARKSRK